MNSAGVHRLIVLHCTVRLVAWRQRDEDAGSLFVRAIRRQCAPAFVGGLFEDGDAANK